MLRGLHSVFESDCLNFVTVSLCDTHVIIDATAFIWNLRNQHPFVKGYGFSPLKVAVLFKNSVEMLLSCNIKPIFIFRGVYNRIVSFYLLLTDFTL